MSSDKPSARGWFDPSAPGVSGTIEMPPIEMLSGQQLSPEALAMMQMQARQKRTRVVITGMGAITPLGHSPEELWRNLLAAKSGIGPVTLFDASSYRTRSAGEGHSGGTLRNL